MSPLVRQNNQIIVEGVCMFNIVRACVAGVFMAASVAVVPVAAQSKGDPTPAPGAAVVSGTAPLQTSNTDASAAQDVFAAAAARRSGSTPKEFGPVPGASRVVMPMATSEEAAKALRSRVMPSNLNQGITSTGPNASATTTTFSTGPKLASAQPAAMRVGIDSAPAGPASVSELARSLRNNVDLIYEHVNNNVAYYPDWGAKKGALGTILDNQGNAFDQSALMVALVRAAGYEARFVHGVVRLTPQDVSAWYGIPTSNACGIGAVLAQGQIPVYSLVGTASATSCPNASIGLAEVDVEHVWVKVNIGGTWYSFDPAFKRHTAKAGIDLAAATGYNQASYLSAAKSGATVSADFVQNLHRANIRNNLTSYANNLASYLRANKPAATLDDVIGGQQIVPSFGVALRQTVHPRAVPGYGVEEWTDIPDVYRSTLRLQYQGIDQTATSDAIYGGLLTITYNGANQPVLRFNGAPVGSPGAAVTPGAETIVTLTVKHNAYTSLSANETVTQRLIGGGGNTFAVVNA
ncbi:MAG: transglutaminase domain-containing protein [Comamonadaceae bacterium]|nr:MAG: transglutaminase domain-containing protein [Comamonadaceae bacterium]